jgi:hypothetical protein
MLIAESVVLAVLSMGSILSANVQPSCEMDKAVHNSINADTRALVGLRFNW